MADNLLSVLFKSAGQAVGSVPDWKARTNLDKIRQAESERAQRRVELEETQMGMKQDAVMRELNAALQAQEQEVKDKEFERIVYTDPKGAVAKGYTTPSEIQQKWPDLWRIHFDPEYKLKIEEQQLKLDGIKIKNALDKYKLEHPNAGGTGDKGDGSVSEKKYRQDLVKQNPGLIVGADANPARIDSLVAGGMGQALPEYVTPVGADQPVKLDMNMFQRSLQQGRQNTIQKPTQAKQQTSKPQGDLAKEADELRQAMKEKNLTVDQLNWSAVAQERGKDYADRLKKELSK